MKTVTTNYTVQDFIAALAVHQVTDQTTGKSHKELVDGQQRAATIRAFHEDKV